MTVKDFYALYLDARVGKGLATPTWDQLSAIEAIAWTEFFDSVS